MKRIYTFRGFVLIIVIALAALVSGCILPKKHPDTEQADKQGKIK